MTLPHLTLNDPPEQWSAHRDDIIARAASAKNDHIRGRLERAATTAGNVLAAVNEQSGWDTPSAAGEGVNAIINDHDQYVIAIYNANEAVNFIPAGTVCETVECDLLATTVATYRASATRTVDVYACRDCSDATREADAYADWE